MVNGRRFIISLTTHPGRIGIVDRTLKSLLNQTFEADKIVVVLSDEEFPDGITRFSDWFRNSVENGDVEVIKVTNDLKAFKKLIPTLIANKDAYVMTADDDVVYPKTHVEGHVKFLTGVGFKTPISCNKCYKYNGSGDHGSIYTYDDFKNMEVLLTDARLINMKQDDLVYGLAISGNGKDYIHRNYQVNGANDVVGLSKGINPSENLINAELYVKECFGVGLNEYRSHKSPGYSGDCSHCVTGIYDPHSLSDGIDYALVAERRQKIDSNKFKPVRNRRPAVRSNSFY